MTKVMDADTRFYIDIDIKTKRVIDWGYGSRYQLNQELANPNHRRIFVTKGQYNKLINTSK